MAYTFTNIAGDRWVGL